MKKSYIIRKVYMHNTRNMKQVIFAYGNHTRNRCWDQPVLSN